MGTFWGAVFFLLIGGGFAGFGGYQVVTTWNFMHAATLTTATVVDRRDSCDDDGCTYRPTFAFQDETGQRQQAEPRFGASNFGFAVGSDVDVYVNPAYPYVRVAGPDNLWLLGGSFFVLGMLPVVLAFWLLARFTFTRERG